MSWYIGVDPGSSGAVAYFNPIEDVLEVHDMPVHEVRVGGRTRKRVDPYQIGLMFTRSDIRRVLVEDVHALPKQGPGSMFAFGQSFGIVLGAIGTAQLPLQLISPVKWKRSLGLSASKDEARRLASRELPKHAHNWPLKKHDGRAEAALLAWICAREAQRGLSM